MARDTPPLEGLDLNLLVTLRALLREASVTRAAERLGQAQPTVSRALTPLREAFDDPLLVRSGRGMALTPLATSLRTPVERALAALDRLPAVGAFDAQADERTFRVIMPDILGKLLMPSLAHRLAQTPHVSLQVLGSLRDELRSLLEDEVDLVVAAPLLQHPELFTRVIAPEGMGWSVIYGPRHPAFDAEMTLERWLESEHVQLTPMGHPDVRSQVDLTLADIGTSRRIRLQVSYLSGLGQILLETRYVASLPTPIARAAAAGLGLKVTRHPLEERLPPIPIRLTWHELHHVDPGNAWLRARVLEAAEAFLQDSQEPPGED